MEIDGLILRYVDGNLDARTAAEIKAVMEANPAVAAHIAEDVRAAKAVEEHLRPSYESTKVPPDPRLAESLEEMIARLDDSDVENPEKDESADVVPFAAPSKPTRRFAQPTWSAMAASIAALLALGGGVYLYDANQDAEREQQIAALDAEIEQATEERAAETDRLTRQVTALGIQLDEATRTRDDLTAQLAEPRLPSRT